MPDPNTRGVFVYLRTYGCQMNVLDSQIIRGLLGAHGFTVVEDEEEADAILFNTCSVRDLSERKALGKLGELRLTRARRPERVLGVLGCMAELSGERLLEKQPHIDFACGTNQRARIPELLTAAFVRRLATAEVTRHNAEALERLGAFFACVEATGDGPRTAIGHDTPERLDERVALRPGWRQAFVEVMRGCSNYCSYCVVPYARGPEVSRGRDDILAEIDALAAGGCVEVTLLGQNVNSYGKDRGDADAFAGLLRAINGIDGIEWIRFVTSNPQDISAEMIAALAECEKVCPQMHFPLQSGSDRILGLMNRRYTCGEYVEKVARIRAAVPGMAFSSDFIVGFPTETEEDFAATLKAQAEVGFASGFIFKYSPRPGTAAATMADDVPPEVKKRRHAELLEQQNALTGDYYSLQHGTVFDVLVEGTSKTDQSMLQGRTAQYANTVFPGSRDLVGRFVPVRMVRSTRLTLYGEQAGPAHLPWRATEKDRAAQTADRGPQ